MSDQMRGKTCVRCGRTIGNSWCGEGDQIFHLDCASDLCVLTTEEVRERWEQSVRAMRDIDEQKAAAESRTRHHQMEWHFEKSRADDLFQELTRRILDPTIQPVIDIRQKEEAEQWK